MVGGQDRCDGGAFAMKVVRRQNQTKDTREGEYARSHRFYGDVGREGSRYSLVASPGVSLAVVFSVGSVALAGLGVSQNLRTWARRTLSTD